jgi:L-alanine-DL-glutamate epimerase-like enolase superfamily enzyme
VRIAAVETRLAALPIQGGHWGDTFHRVTHIEYCFAEVTSDAGLKGLGFTHTSGVGGSTIRHLIDRELGPLVIGMEAAPRPVWHAAWHHIRDLGGGGFTTMALAAIDIALWDLVAQEAGKPLVDYLGRVRPSIRAYASGINLNKPLDELLDQVRNWIRKGYTAFKVKVGKPDVQEDVERLTKIREIIGSQPLMVDANQGWDIGEAVRRINAYQHLSPYWIEEPMLADDIDGHGRLRQLVRSPIGVGENVYTIQQWNQYLSRGAVDFVQADVCRVGGITPYLDIAALARAYGVPLAPHFVMELSAQLLCCLPNGHILEDVEGGSFTDLLCLAEPTPVQDGHFAPAGQRPGHGILFNDDYVRENAVRDAV